MPAAGDVTGGAAPGAPSGATDAPPPTIPGPLRVVIVGAGPRGVSVCERLVHLHSGPQRLIIDLVDPFSPGSGRVWRTDQPPELLMNTTVNDQTVFPDESTGLTPANTGSPMDEWWAATGHSQPADSTFAPRRDYGAYLEWAFDHIVESADASTSIRTHQVTVTAIRDLPQFTAATTPDDLFTSGPRGSQPSGPVPSGSQPSGTESTVAPPGRVQRVVLDSGATIDADAVVLCVGHISSQVRGESAMLASFAQESSLTYLPPNLPAETPVGGIKPGETVLFRGFGLNYFDLQALLTTGRGGTFEPAGDHLRYRPSGQEPHVAPASRRGIPYRCKPITPEHPGSHASLRYFTPASLERLEAVNRAAASRDSASGAHSGGSVDALSGSQQPSIPARGLTFNEQLWPLILADARAAWYCALARSAPQQFRGSLEVMLQALDSSAASHLERGHTDDISTAASPELADPDDLSWAQVEDRELMPTAPRFDLSRLARPLDGLSFTTREGGPVGQSFQEWMRAFLLDELTEARKGPAHSPGKAVFAALWEARALLKEVVADSRLDRLSFVRDVRGWFENLVSGICDGPPPQRFAELIALADAGLVTFVGPNVHIEAHTDSAGHNEFAAQSPAVPGEVTATTLVEAVSPANNVRFAGDVLISSMIDAGQLTPAALAGPDGIELPLSGLLVRGPEFHTVDAQGREHPRRFVLSIQLSTIQLGLAIAANPHRNARSLRDAHTIASAILALAD